jgi:hypothetical protein
VHILRAIYKTAITATIHHESAPRSSDTAVSAGAACYSEALKDNHASALRGPRCFCTTGTPAATHRIRIPRPPRSKASQPDSRRAASRDVHGHLPPSTTTASSTQATRKHTFQASHGSRIGDRANVFQPGPVGEGWTPALSPECECGGWTG